MCMTEWFDRDETGRVLLHVLLKWRIGSLPSSALFLGLEYHDGEDSSDEERTKAIPFVMSPDMALRLAEGLAFYAREILHGPEPLPKGTILQ